MRWRTEAQTEPIHLPARHIVHHQVEVVLVLERLWREAAVSVTGSSAQTTPPDGSQSQTGAVQRSQRALFSRSSRRTCRALNTFNSLCAEWSAPSAARDSPYLDVFLLLELDHARFLHDLEAIVHACGFVAAQLGGAKGAGANRRQHVVPARPVSTVTHCLPTASYSCSDESGSDNLAMHVRGQECAAPWPPRTAQSWTADSARATSAPPAASVSGGTAVPQVCTHLGELLRERRQRSHLGFRARYTLRCQTMELVDL